ncbi:MAG: MmcQ/YjbR family DNA-binding protein [Bacteroidia bacterium]
MKLEDIRSYCLSLPGVTESIKWEDHLCFCVAEKMFLITSPDLFPVTTSLKTSDELFEQLTTREGLIPAPYLARYKWIHIDSLDRLTNKEWMEYINLSYQLVFEKLPAKKKQQINNL